MKPRFFILSAAFAWLTFMPIGAYGQDFGDLLAPLTETDGQTAGRIIQLAGLLTVLSIAPGLMITVTSFTRFIIALSFLRAGLGLATTPANLVMVSLALFMTLYVMTPTFERSWNDGLKPLLDNEISEEQALPAIAEPFRDFMTANVRPNDVALFQDLSIEQNGGVEVGSDEAIPYHILIPAFMISELRRAFEIGFLIVLPFLVIDLVVATLTMSMGMMMLPPTVLSLPFKVLFFILIDGWHLLVGSLVRSYI